MMTSLYVISPSGPLILDNTLLHLKWKIKQMLIERCYEQQVLIFQGMVSLMKDSDVLGLRCKP